MRARLAALLALAALPASVDAQEPLEVPGHRAAVFVAADGGGARALVVALHGNFDRPEWACAAWDRIVRRRAFLLCPRGEPRADAPGLDRWQLPLAGPLAREIAAARRALAARHPGALDEGPDVYVGFSQGAHRIARFALTTPARYPRVQLVEGGDALWSGPGAAARPGARVAFVCATAWCARRGRGAVAALARGGAEARLERRPGAHHELDVMEPAIRETFEWRVRDDARFAPPGGR